MPTPKKPGRKRLEIVAEAEWIDRVSEAALASDRTLSSYIRQAVGEASSAMGLSRASGPRRRSPAAARRERPTRSDARPSEDRAVIPGGYEHRGQSGTASSLHDARPDRDHGGRAAAAALPCGAVAGLGIAQALIIVLAGTQSGKTVFGPLWLWREISRCGPGDYLVVAPTDPLLNIKALPEFQQFFEHTLGLGKLKTSPRPLFTFSKEGARRTFGRTPDEPNARDVRPCL